MDLLRKAFLSTSILALGVAAAPAMAQVAPPPQTQAPAPAQSPTPTAKPTSVQLQNFAQASQKVAMVAEEYQPKLLASSDESARQQVMQEADEKMIQLVSAEGLTVDEYNGISMAVKQDPKLRQRVIDLVSKSSG